MSVGAGSIRRAAKTAGAAKGSETVPEPVEKAMPEPETAEKATAKKTRKKPEPKAVKDKAVKDKTVKKTPAKAEKTAPAAAKEAAAPGKQAYEAYGIGQQLPVHLL